MPTEKRIQKSSVSLRDAGVVLALFVLIALFYFSSEYFFSVSNFMNIGRQISVLAVAAFAMTFVIISGEIDLSIGPVTSLSGILAAMVMARGMPASTAVITALLTGLFFSFVTGSLIIYAQVPSFIASLGAFSVAQGIAYALTDGRAVAILNIRYIYTFSDMKLIGIPISIIIVGTLFVLLHLLLSRSNFGTRVYAVGGNPDAARYSGLSVAHSKLGVFILDGLLIGIAGVLLSARLGTGFVDGARNLELDAIAAVVLGGTSFTGGKGALWRTVVGVLIIGLLNNGLSLVNVNTYFQISIKGLIIVTAVFADQLIQRRSA